MSETINYADLGLDDDDEGLAPNDLVGKLRKALKAQQKALNAKDDEINTLKGENTTLKGQVTATSLERLLKDKGAKPQLSKFMSGVEATEEAVTAWLSENGELFGYDPNSNQSGEAGAGAAEQQGAKLDPEMEAILAAMKQVQNQEANAAPGLNVGEEKNLDFLNRVGQNASSFEDVEKAMRSAGFFNLPG